AHSRQRAQVPLGVGHGYLWEPVERRLASRGLRECLQDRFDARRLDLRDAAGTDRLLDLSHGRVAHRVPALKPLPQCQVCDVAVAVVGRLREDGQDQLCDRMAMRPRRGHPIDKPQAVADRAHPAGRRTAPGCPARGCSGHAVHRLHVILASGCRSPSTPSNSPARLCSTAGPRPNLRHSSTSTAVRRALTTGSRYSSGREVWPLTWSALDVRQRGPTSITHSRGLPTSSSCFWTNSRSRLSPWSPTIGEPAQDSCWLSASRNGCRRWC